MRNVDLETGHPLAKLVAEKPEVVQLVKITSADKEDNLAAAQVVKEKYGKVDVIIANAGKLDPLDSRVVPTNHYRSQFRRTTYQYCHCGNHPSRLHHQHHWTFGSLPIVRSPTRVL